MQGNAKRGEVERGERLSVGRVRKVAFREQGVGGLQETQPAEGERARWEWLPGTVEGFQWKI